MISLRSLKKMKEGNAVVLVSGPFSFKCPFQYFKCILE